MTTFDDLIERAMPYLMTEEAAGTASASWQWTYDLSAYGLTSDLTSGYTATAVIKASRSDASSIVAVSCSFPTADRVRCTVAPSLTVGLTPGRYLHEVEVTRTADGRRLKVVGSGGGTFIVKPGQVVAPDPAGSNTNVAADTDGSPYYTAGATGVTVLADTDGVPYWSTTGTTLPVLADTDGVPYVAA